MSRSNLATPSALVFEICPEIVNMVFPTGCGKEPACADEIHVIAKTALRNDRTKHIVFVLR
jgi:hypothetical protein